MALNANSNRKIVFFRCLNSVSLRVAESNLQSTTDDGGGGDGGVMFQVLEDRCCADATGLTLSWTAPPSVHSTLTEVVFGNCPRGLLNCRDGSHLNREDAEYSNSFHK